MLLERVELPDASIGEYRIESFITDRVDFGSLLKGRGVPVGQKFTKLTRSGKVVMSDTPAEMRDHYAPVVNAKASCLINGLGIGMVLRAILKKPEVSDVIVVEISSEVIDMVAPHYADARVTFVHADALAYKPAKGKRFGMVWHDIWDAVCTDNLPEMATLHRRYGSKADWQGSWSKDECISQKRADERRDW